VTLCFNHVLKIKIYAMQEIFKGIIKGFELIISLDREIIEISWRSLWISGLACFISCIFCIPIGFILYFYKIPAKGLFLNMIQTLYALPTVLVGLFLFLLLSKEGPLGELNLLFTPWAMVIGQAIIVSPIIIGLTISTLSNLGKEVYETALSIGGSEFQALLQVLREVRFSLISSLLLGFGRAISEVGCAIMVGGNIRGYTRVLTTAISLETGKGNLELSIALGIILLAVALIVNVLLNLFQGRYGWR
jgi:tungstate transport system permease protein